MYISNDCKKIWFIGNKIETTEKISVYQMNLNAVENGAQVIVEDGREFQIVDERQILFVDEQEQLILMDLLTKSKYISNNNGEGKEHNFILEFK